MVVDGVKRSTANWSLGGLALKCAEGDTSGFVAEGAVSGELGQPDQPDRFAFEGRVVRADHKRDLVAVEFTTLSPGAVMLFIHEFRHMIGGTA